MKRKGYEQRFAASQKALETFVVQVEKEKRGWTGSIEEVCVGVTATSAEDAHKAAHIQAFREIAYELEAQLKDPAEVRPLSHVGLNRSRCENSVSEKAFAEAWSKRNDKPAGSAVGYLAQIMNPASAEWSLTDEHQVLTWRDCLVAATVIQWLGSNGGAAFLEEVLAVAGTSYLNKLKLQPPSIQIDLDVFTTNLAQKLEIYTKTIQQFMNLTASEHSPETVKSLVNSFISEQVDPAKAQEILIPIQEAFLKEWNEQ